MRQHFIQYRLYGSTLYNTGYTTAHYTVEAIQKHIIKYRLNSSKIYSRGYTEAHYTIEAI
jgi:hypothetical protein